MEEALLSYKLYKGGMWMNEFKKLIARSLKQQYSEVLLQEGCTADIVLASGEPDVSTAQGGVWSRKKLYKVLDFLHSDPEMLKIAKQQGPVKARFEVSGHQTIYAISGIDDSRLWIRFFIGEQAKVKFTQVFKDLSDQLRESHVSSVPAVQSIGMSEVGKVEEVKMSVAASQVGEGHSRVVDEIDKVDEVDEVDEEDDMDDADLQSFTSALAESTDAAPAKSRSAQLEQEFRNHVKRDRQLATQPRSHQVSAQLSSAQTFTAGDDADDDEGISFSELNSEMPGVSASQSMISYQSSYIDQPDHSLVHFAEQPSSSGSEVGAEVAQLPEDFSEQKLTESEQIFTTSFQLDRDSYVGEISPEALAGEVEDDEDETSEVAKVAESPDSSDGWEDDFQAEQPPSSYLDLDELGEAANSSTLAVQEGVPALPVPMAVEAVDQDYEADDDEDFQATVYQKDPNQSPFSAHEDHQEDHSQDSLKSFLYETVMVMSDARDQVSGGESIASHMAMSTDDERENIDDPFNMIQLLGELVTARVSEMRLVSAGTQHMTVMSHYLDGRSPQLQQFNEVKSSQLLAYITQYHGAQTAHPQKSRMAVPVTVGGAVRWVEFWINQQAFSSGMVRMLIRRLDVTAASGHHQQYYGALADKIHQVAQTLSASDEGHFICMSGESGAERARLGYALMDKVIQLDKSAPLLVKTLEPQGFFTLGKQSLYEPEFLGGDELLWGQALKDLAGSMESHQRGDAKCRRVLFISGMPSALRAEFVQHQLKSLLASGVTVIWGMSAPSVYLGWQQVVQSLVGDGDNVDNIDNSDNSSAQMAGHHQLLFGVMKYLRGFLGSRRLGSGWHSFNHSHYLEGWGVSYEQAMVLAHQGVQLEVKQFYGDDYGVVSFEAMLCEQLGQPHDGEFSLQQAYIIATHPEYLLQLAEQRGIRTDLLSVDVRRASPVSSSEIIHLTDPGHKSGVA